MTKKIAPTEIEIDALLAGRWSPRAISNKAVSREQLHSVLEAARWAPSASNLQPWRFLTFDRNHDEAAFQKAFATLVPFNQGWNANVPVLICALASTVTPKGEVNRLALYDTGAAAMSLVLQAHALGLLAHQMAGFDTNAFREAFSLPDDVEVIAMISLGHHGDPASLNGTLLERENAPRSRSAIGEIAFDGAWGKAFK
ncbi:nitroreductase family protein [Caballeronia sp. KNU42]|jgi:nitroreductase